MEYSLRAVSSIAEVYEATGYDLAALEDFDVEKDLDMIVDYLRDYMPELPELLEFVVIPRELLNKEFDCNDFKEDIVYIENVYYENLDISKDVGFANLDNLVSL